MTILQDVDTAVSVTFWVQLDDQALGMFTSCEGLGVEVVMETREEGGFNTAVWQLPTRLKYPNIKLSRPLGKDTEKVAEWFAEMTKGYKRRTATIKATAAGDPSQVVAQWHLNDVVPVRWTGPSISSDQLKILTETVEIAHHGFLPAGR